MQQQQQKKQSRKQQKKQQSRKQRKQNKTIRINGGYVWKSTASSTKKTRSKSVSAKKNTKSIMSSMLPPVIN